QGKSAHYYPIPHSSMTFPGNPTDIRPARHWRPRAPAPRRQTLPISAARLLPDRLAIGVLDLLGPDRADLVGDFLGQGHIVQRDGRLGAVVECPVEEIQHGLALGRALLDLL